MKSKIKSTALNTFFSAAVLAASAAGATLVQVQDAQAAALDTTTHGQAMRVTRADPYTDGARVDGKRDQYIDGARIDRPRSPYTDGASLQVPRDPFTSGAHGNGALVLTGMDHTGVSAPPDNSAV